MALLAHPVRPRAVLASLLPQVVSIRAITVAQRGVGANGEQVLNDLVAALVCGDVQGGAAGAVLGVDGDAPLDQQAHRGLGDLSLVVVLHGVGVGVAADGTVEGRVLAEVAGGDVAAAVEQQTGNGAAVAGDAQQQRLVGAVGLRPRRVGAVVQEHADDLELARAVAQDASGDAGPPDGAPPDAVDDGSKWGDAGAPRRWRAAVDLRAAREEELHGREVVAQGRAEQGGALVRFDVGAGVEQDAHDVVVAEVGGFDDGRAAAVVDAVHAAALGDRAAQQPRPVRDGGVGDQTAGVQHCEAPEALVELGRDERVRAAVNAAQREQVARIPQVRRNLEQDYLGRKGAERHGERAGRGPVLLGRLVVGGWWWEWGWGAGREWGRRWTEEIARLR